MAAPKQNAIQIPVTLTLTAQSFEFLEKNSPEGKIAEQLASWVKNWMDQQSRGGLMLDSVDHDALADANGGKRFRDSRSLTRAVMKGLNRDDGAFSFRVLVDPAYVQPLEEQATASAMTVEELVTGIIDMVVTKGWLWDFSPADGRNIPFTAQMLTACAELCDKHRVDSADISGLIAEDRLLPITRDMKTKLKSLAPEKVDFASADLDGLLDELKAARAELAGLRTAPRELVAA